jgi:glyoxylase-like metal-dependent hydrolase (beta-lactamase superfamily II)
MNTTRTLDTLWTDRPHSIATALLQSEGHRALIDPGPASTVESLRQALQQHGLQITDLDAILLTHIHLDHAGATGTLIRENPGLAVYVHAKGAPHLIDPSKLLNSAGRLWGDRLPRLFGETLPVPPASLKILEGGETLQLGARQLAVAYTPGHAGHHVSYFDDAESVAFVGDTAGIRIDNGPYILPATPPPDINLELWDESFAKILQHQPARLFLTHYGYAENPAEHLAEFRERLHQWAAAAEQCLLKNLDDVPAASRDFVSAARDNLVAAVAPAEADHYAFTAGLDLSFLGLARYLQKRNQSTKI